MTSRLDRSDSPGPGPLRGPCDGKRKPATKVRPNSPAGPLLDSGRVGFNVEYTWPPLGPPTGVDQEIPDLLWWCFDPPGDDDSDPLRRSRYCECCSEAVQPAVRFPRHEYIFDSSYIGFLSLFQRTNVYSWWPVVTALLGRSLREYVLFRRNFGYFNFTVERNCVLNADNLFSNEINTGDLEPSAPVAPLSDANLPVVAFGDLLDNA